MGTSITIRDIPNDVRDELAARAALAGRSLQEHLRAELIELAERPSPDVLVSQMRTRKKATGSRLSPARILRVALAASTSASVPSASPFAELDDAHHCVLDALLGLGDTACHRGSFRLLRGGRRRAQSSRMRRAPRWLQSGTVDRA